ncbi:electron transfer flavoprotein subunit beta/FixA family protein [Dactylosporangium maewongense]|uniref:Electron transfer flavoprotein subunit beta/FixA family protein n=1 Tax=Dactylosporangium maewongense TaxID=634393 RepID=A0ABP4NTC1_9ACTN
MHIAVCIKRVGTTDDDIEFTDDGRSVDPDYLDYGLNEWDAAAIAEALRLRDQAGGGRVVVVTAGDDESEEVLVQGLAMGADHAVRVESDPEGLVDPVTVGRVLAVAIRPLGVDLVLCGAQSADAAQGTTAAALAGVLDLPCATVVTGIDREPAGTTLVRRELEGGVVDVIRISGPAVLSIQTGIAEPRYVTLRALQQAQQQDIEVVDADLDDLGEPGYRIRRMVLPPAARAEIVNGGAAAIAAKITELVRGAAK